MMSKHLIKHFEESKVSDWIYVIILDFLRFKFPHSVHIHVQLFYIFNSASKKLVLLFFFVVISMCLMASIEQQLKVCNLAEIIETICVLLRIHLSAVSCAGLDLS